MELATRWKRLFGALIDGLIGATVMLLLLLITGQFNEVIGNREQSFVAKLAWGFVGLGVFLILNGYLLAKYGQTIGKRVIGTRIVDLNGNIPPFGKLLFLRYVVLWIITQIPCVGGLFGLVDALFIFNGDRRCIHDHIAGTKVVNAQ